MKIGDIVVSIDSGYPLRSGAQLYGHAIVVNDDPIVLVSEHADMRWESTVKKDKLKVVGVASDEVLSICMERKGS